MWKANYHTHTTRCKHARDSDEDYVIKAIQAGFKEIGFADHCPWPFEDGYVSPMRMDVAQLEDYVSSVKSLREKYQGQIDVKLGLECEYFETMIPWLVAEKERLSIDYLIFGNHFPEIESNHYYDHTPGDSVKAIKDYLRVSLQGIESEIFAYMAHPDVFMRAIKPSIPIAKKLLTVYAKKPKSISCHWSIIWRAIRMVAIRILNFGRSLRKSAALVLLGSMPTRVRLSQIQKFTKELF
ncbi:histidinol-phosphatase [Enterococcus entomosocium]|uniref:Histidinol-phosphatase n=1 Tax=Enterococcus entomosocium TaxID=3034352 RepID=A0ABV3MCA7_9ENTE|nr:histidinol-phosphatase [Enterococcus casseliflavus]MDB1708332.1 histidinol-phosphatase [Enterococcus casseliflavus]MDB1714714.1 histidinol-phosphatase [Enterococcus casseliflavus]